MGHAATTKRELRLKRLWRLLSDRPLTEAEVEEGLRPFENASRRAVHDYLKLLTERGDAVVVRSRHQAQDTPRYVAAYRGVPVMEEVGGLDEPLVLRRTFGRVTYVSDAD